MNNSRRKEIGSIADALSMLQERLTVVRDEEEEALENLPESMADGERADTMRDAIAVIEEHIDAIDSAVGALSDLAGA